jgi:predicted DNA-binding protein
MTNINFEPTPQKSFPLRLEHNLYQRFTNMASTTKIPKSTLARLAISKFLDDIESKGITLAIKDVESK